jgi:hypothetical protein
VFCVRSRSHSRQECNCIANIKAPNNEGVEAFSEELSVGELEGFLKLMVLLSAVCGACEEKELSSFLIGDGGNVVPVRLIRAWVCPSVSD